MGNIGKSASANGTEPSNVTTLVNINGGENGYYRAGNQTNSLMGSPYSGLEQVRYAFSENSSTDRTSEPFLRSANKDSVSSESESEGVPNLTEEFIDIVFSEWNKTLETVQEIGVGTTEAGPLSSATSVWNATSASTTFGPSLDPEGWPTAETNTTQLNATENTDTENWHFWTVLEVAVPGICLVFFLRSFCSACLRASLPCILLSHVLRRLDYCVRRLLVTINPPLPRPNTSRYGLSRETPNITTATVIPESNYDL